MISLKPAVTGDVNDARTVRLDGVANLSAVSTITSHVWRVGVAHAVLATTVVDADARTVRISLGGAGGWLASAVPDTYSVEVEATFADGSVLTWPDARPMTLTVREQGDT